MLDKKTVIALGYFDSVHLGHRKVMQEAKCYALEQGARFCVFTFGGNLKAFFGDANEKNVYSPNERDRIIRSLGVDEVYFASVTKEFLSLDKKAFLDQLNKKYNIICYVSGKDYTYGNKGEGNATYLEEYAKEHGQKYIVVDMVSEGGEKISTTRIKELLTNGNVKKAGELLGENYSITGKVFKDRCVGRNLGFPTVNVKIEKDKHGVADGVYKGHAFIDGNKYLAVINYGARPTFDLSERLLEAHFIDFNGDLYGKEITVYFDDFLRQVKKFKDVEELIFQLKEDVEKTRG